MTSCLEIILAVEEEAMLREPSRDLAELVHKIFCEMGESAIKVGVAASMLIRDYILIVASVCHGGRRISIHCDHVPIHTVLPSQVAGHHDITHVREGGGRRGRLIRGRVMGAGLLRGEVRRLGGLLGRGGPRGRWWLDDGGSGWSWSVGHLGSRF